MFINVLVLVLVLGLVLGPGAILSQRELPIWWNWIIADTTFEKTYLNNWCLDYWNTFGRVRSWQTTLNRRFDDCFSSHLSFGAYNNWWTAESRLLWHQTGWWQGKIRWHKWSIELLRGKRRWNEWSIESLRGHRWSIKCRRDWSDQITIVNELWSWWLF